MNKIKILKSVVNILKREEGWRGYIYDDYDGHRLTKGDTVRGYPTAMYGFTRFLNDRIPQELYETFPRWGDLGLALHVNKIIDYDLLKFTKYLPHLNDVRLVVLICMIFQLGANGVSGFVNMLKAIEEEDWKIAEYHGLDSKWYRIDSPHRAVRMMNIMKSGKL